MKNVDLIPVIQAAISPMILISGNGLLILAMSNRMARIIDRSRRLLDARKAGEPVSDFQLEIILRRARLLRSALSLAVISALFAALIIICIFIFGILDIQLAWLVMGLFTLGMLSMIGSLGFFVIDVHKSLHALEADLPPAPLRPVR